MSKTYDNSTINIFPEGFKMVLPDGYRIDTEYDDDYNEVYHLRGGFYTNDDGEEDFAFTGSFLTLNVNLKVNEDADPQARANLYDPSHPDFAFNQVIEGVKGNLDEQYGEGKCIKLYNSLPVSALMKYYQPFSIFGVTLDTYLLFYWVEVNESTVFGFTSVYRNDQAGAEEYHKHLMNVIKSVRVNGNPVDVGKLTPKKLEQALDLEASEDAEALDLGLSIGINFQNGDEETQYTINSDGSITEEIVNTGLCHTTPDEALYPHYNSMLRSQGLGMLGLFGVNVVVNQTGTEYKFYNLEEDLDEDASDELKDAISQLKDTGASRYTLADRAKEMMPVFHVSPEVFDTAHDRESELQEGMMHRAYMMSALRSFAWTMAKYCDALSKKPADLSLEQIQNIIDTIADANWLNYDNKSVCKGLCGTQDLHVYYLPDKTSASVKAVFMPSQEVIDQTKQMQEKFPNYNPILSQIGSLDKLREDLEYIHPAIEKIYEDLKASRNNNEALTGNDADILYAWCALSYAARGPFFSEDGPTSCWFSQTISEEERRVASEKERKELCEKWLAYNGQYIEKDPEIEFSGKKFVFTGLGYRQYSMGDETDYTKLIEDRGGLTRRSVSGVTDYLVVEPAGAGEAKIQAMIENKKNGKPAKIILIDDLRKALGLQDFESDTEGAVSAVTTADESVAEKAAQVFEETVIVDNTWAVVVPVGFRYCTDKSIIMNHRNIIIMEDKPENDFEDPFSASISFTSSYTEVDDPVAIAKMKNAFMGVDNAKVLKDENDIYVAYNFDSSSKVDGSKLDIFKIDVGCGKAVSIIQVFFNDSKLSRREQTKLVEKVAKSIRLSKPDEKNAKRIVKQAEANKAQTAEPVNEIKDQETIKSEEYASKMFGILTVELNRGMADKGRLDFYMDHEKKFPDLSRKEIGDLRDKIRKEMKNKERYEYYASQFLKLPVKDRFECTTLLVFNLFNYIDYYSNGMWSIQETAEWYKPDELSEVKALVLEKLEDMRKQKDAYLERINRDWMHFSTAKKYLKVRLDSPDAYTNTDDDTYWFNKHLYSDYYSNALAKVFLEVPNSLLQAYVVGTFYTYYWNVTDTQIWEAACRNGVDDNRLYGEDGDKLLAENMHEIRKRCLGTVNDISDLEKESEDMINRFISVISGLISGANDTDLEKRIKKSAKEIFYDANAFSWCREKLAAESFKRGLPFLDEMLKEDLDSRTLYQNMPDLIAKEIRAARKERIEAENAKKYADAERLLTSDDLSGILKAASMFKELKDYRDSKDRLKECKAAEKQKKANLYNEAQNHFKEGTENSITKAIVILDELDQYKDAPTLVETYRKALETEKKYVSVKNLFDASGIDNLKKACSMLEELTGYKDSSDLLRSCREEIEKHKAAKYAEAMSLIKQLTMASLTEARSILTELTPYRDAESSIEKLDILIGKEHLFIEASEKSKSDSLGDLLEAKDLLVSLGGYKRSATDVLINQCSNRIEHICAEKYAKAILLAEEKTVDSIKSAISVMESISSYKDSDSKISEFYKLLQDERVYMNAVALSDSTIINDVTTAKGLFENLGKYKDSDIKASACGRRIDELCEALYQEAREAENVYSINSQNEAIAKYTVLGDYKDSKGRIQKCDNNTKIIKEILQLNKEIDEHKKELEGLMGLFKRKERKAKENQIAKKEMRVAELKQML